eukprot:2157583-Rhodomonas_salina.3
MYLMQCCFLYAGHYSGRGHQLYQRTRVLSGWHSAMFGYKGSGTTVPCALPSISCTSPASLLQVPAPAQYRQNSGGCCVQSAWVTCQSPLIKGTAAFRLGSAYWLQELLREAGQNGLDLPGATERGLLCTAVPSPGA